MAKITKLDNDDGRMGRTVKISDVVFELLGDIGKKSETYSEVIERIAREAHYEIKPEYIKRAEEHLRRRQQQERT
ncbi:MAG: hypothetical protein WA364_15060 [Candidatus Nitrosopolaris sp.]